MKSSAKWLLAVFSTASIFLATFSHNATAVTFPDIDGVKQGRAPYLVALWTVNRETLAREELFCSGVLIDPYHFLTAAHCLEGDESFVAVAGVTKNSERGQTLILTDYLIHPRYDEKSLQNDIAIARLYYGVDQAAEWGKFIGKYPSIPDNDKKFRKDMRVFGWGDKQNGKSSSVVTSVKQDEYKREAKESFKSMNEATMLGAGFKYKSENLYAGACYGDSGGPLVANESTSPALIGLVSYGSAKGCDVKKPTIYTRVAYYKNWIGTAKAKLATNWKTKGIKPGAKPSSFSLPVFSTRFIDSEKDDYGTNSYIQLSVDPDAGRADVSGIMMQNYKNKMVGVNLYFSNVIDGCLLRQKGNIKLQIATNSFQDIDFSVSVNPSNSCFKNDLGVTISQVKLPPNDFRGNCSVFVKPFKGGEGPYVRATDIDAISLAWDSRCLGKVSQIWARALVSINDNKNETDLEPGSDMWVGPLKPSN
jgi:secreted trypsin-like serine protease